MWNGGFYNKHYEQDENVYESIRLSKIRIEFKQNIHRRIIIIHKNKNTPFI